MAILRFRIYWEDDDSVYRDIAIRHTQNFFDLHSTILKSFEFDSMHMATFYRSNDNWLRGREISLEKYDKEYKAEPLIMAETTIGSEISNPNQKFIYEYDFNKYWHFMVELITVDKEEDKKLSLSLLYPYRRDCSRRNTEQKAWLTAGLPRWKKNTTCGPMHCRMDSVKKEMKWKQMLKKKRRR